MEDMLSFLNDESQIFQASRTDHARIQTLPSSPIRLDNLANLDPEQPRGPAGAQLCFGTIISYNGRNQMYEMEVDLVENNKIFVSARDTYTKHELGNGDQVYVTYTINEDDEEEEDDECPIIVHSIAPITDQGIGLVTDFSSDSVTIDENYYLPRSLMHGSPSIKYQDAIEYEALKCINSDYHYRCVWGKKLDPITKADVFPKADQLVGRIETVKANRKGLTVPIDEVVFELTGVGEATQKKIPLTNISAQISHRLIAVYIVKDDTTLASQFQLVAPDFSAGPLIVSPESRMEIVVEAVAREEGIFQESIFFDFGSFKILRSLKLVCGNQEFIKKYTMPFEPALDQPGHVLYENAVRLRLKPMILRTQNSSVKRTPVKTYPIPTTVKKILLEADWQRFLQDVFYFIFEPLNPMNYTEKLHISLFVDEIALFKTFQQKTRKDVILRKSTGDAYLVDIPNIAENRPSLLVGDRVQCENKPKNKQFTGAITELREHGIALKMEPDFEAFSQLPYDISFHFSRGAYNIQHNAIDMIAAGYRFKSIFPESLLPDAPLMDVTLADNGKLTIAKSGVKQPLSLSRNDFDPSQRQVIMNVLRAEYRAMPYLIRGPPGTGKTTTLVEIILQIIMHMEQCHVLVCTQSNSAANLILSKLMESKKVLKEEVIRVISNNVYASDSMPLDLKRYCATFSDRDPSLPDAGPGEVMVGLDLISLCEYRVVISTCGCVRHLHNLNLSTSHFTHLILDEAGQCLETETIIPIALMENSQSQIILSGDDKQLGPVVMCPELDPSNFGVSLFERIITTEVYDSKNARYNKAVSNQLNYNYRSVPSILHLFNGLFYAHSLKAMVLSGPKFECLKQLQAVLPKCADRKDTQGVVFYNVLGTNIRSASNPSWLNPKEATTIIDLLGRMLNEGISLDDIGIIAPYQGQVRYLREQAVQRGLDFAKIGSVEEFQGQEKPIIILSTVRSVEKQFEFDKKFNLGFLHNPKRMNVAISRSQSLLIVVGHEAILSLDENWKRLITFCKSKSAYYESEKELVEHLAEVHDM